MSIRRESPHELGGGGGELDPLAQAVWIRPFRLEDVPRIQTLVAGVLAEFDLELDPADTDRDLADPELHYRIRGGELWVVEDGLGRVVGSCGLWLDPDDPERCEVRKMYLSPSLRGRGLGRRLLETALEQARRVERPTVELETNGAMTTAIALYRSAGFVEVEGGDGGRCERRFRLET